MRSLIILLALSCGVDAWAGPTGGSDVHSTAATGYSGAYLQTVQLSLNADPVFGSRFLDSFELHLRSVAAMTEMMAVIDYLEVAVIGARTQDELTKTLGIEPMETLRLTALLLVQALARPEQLHEVLQGLEARKAGLGKGLAQLLRETRGRGDRRLIHTLRSCGVEHAKRLVKKDSRFERLGRFIDLSFSVDPIDQRSLPSPKDLDSGLRLRRSGLRPPQE